MRRLVFTDSAEEDLEAIGDHIASDSPRRAQVFVSELRESCLNLAELPMRFPVVPQFSGLGIRRRVHGNYIIFYRVTGRSVEILHVLHGAMDYERLFFPED